MRRRGHRQDVHEHRFVIAGPIVVDEAAFGIPAHRDQRLALLQPGPIDALVERVGNFADFRLARVAAIVVALRKQHAHHQQAGIHARHLDPWLVALALLHVEEVVVEAVIAALAFALRALRRIAEELQRGQRAVDRLRAADPTVLDPDRIRGQREAHRRDAREGSRRETVRRQAVDFIGRVPEELERAPFDVAE